MQLTGTGLAKWINNGSCRPLEKDEERYTRPPKTVFAHGSPPDGTVQLRSCVINNVTKAKRFDINWSVVAKHPILSFVADEGPRDSPFFYWASSFLRVFTVWDPLHRLPRDLYLTAERAGMWQMVLDTTGVLNWDHAPYNSLENFDKAVSGIREYVEKAGDNDELLLDTFEELLSDAGKPLPFEYGSREHLQNTIKELPFARCFQKMPEKVKWTRWGSHHWSAVGFLPDLGLKRLATKVVSMLSGDIFVGGTDDGVATSSTAVAVPAAAHPALVPGSASSSKDGAAPPPALPPLVAKKVQETDRFK